MPHYGVRRERFAWAVDNSPAPGAVAYADSAHMAEISAFAALGREGMKVLPEAGIHPPEV
ncbi:hypothetical protein [Streptomyces triticisoli]|jgi:hypothetical protein|uniref:hypothetical protein n=1 Tax=Streptomyces triticisoli TaxID=2182797 RepID=UPI000DDA9A24|nr:hypothetical protein [Streptomyces triticisoli]